MYKYSKGEKKSTVTAVWSCLDHHQFASAWDYVAYCRKRYPWHHADSKVVQFFPFKESRSGSKLGYCCEKVQSTYENLYGPSSWGVLSVFVSIWYAIDPTKVKAAVPGLVHEVTTPVVVFWRRYGVALVRAARRKIIGMVMRFIML